MSSSANDDAPSLAILTPMHLRAGTIAAVVLVSCGSFDSADAPPNDAGAADASTDAPTDAASDAAVSCGWKAFDDDFERTLLIGDWDASDGPDDPTMTLAISDVRGASSAKSMLVDTLSGFGPRHRYLRKNLAKAGAATPCIDVHLSVYVEAIKSSVRVVEIGFSTKLLYVRMDTGSAPSGALVEMREQQFSGPSDAGSNVRNIAAGEVEIGKWVDLGVHFDIATAAPTLFIDGKLRTSSRPELLAAGDTPVDVRAGCTYVENDGGRYFIDRVAVR
jgi:hypothetical protein